MSTLLVFMKLRSPWKKLRAASVAPSRTAHILGGTPPNIPKAAFGGLFRPDEVRQMPNKISQLKLPYVSTALKIAQQKALPQSGRARLKKCS